MKTKLNREASSKELPTDNSYQCQNSMSLLAKSSGFWPNLHWLVACFSLLCMLPERCKAQTLNSGEALTNSISTAGQEITHTFYASPGETVYVSLVNLDGNNASYNPMLQVYEPVTGLAEWTSDLDAGTINGQGETRHFTASRDGTYSVHVREYYGSYTGSYRLEIRRVPASLPVTQFGTTINLSSGQAVTNAINPSGHLEYLTFSAKSGDVVRISLVNLGGNHIGYNPMLQVYEPVTGLPEWTSDLDAGTINGQGDTRQFTAIRDGIYSVVVWEYHGSYTGTYQIMVSGATSVPVITANPQSRTNAVGTLASFTVAATGPAPLGYQWRFNAANLVGATSTNYTIQSVQPTNAGSYTVVVTNLFGSVTSAPAILAVQGQPILRTLRLLSATAPNVLLQSDGYAGETILVQCSTNLGAWFNTESSNNCPTNGLYTFSLPKTNSASAVFYRSRISWRP